MSFHTQPDLVPKMQATPGYAEAQIRVLLKDLADSSHNTRIKAVAKFKDYIHKIRPELYDDDVEYLFTGGAGNGKLPNGLLYYAGQSSDKHDGQLKRISAPVIELISWLISIDMVDSANDQKLGVDGNNIYDNIFYDQFICLSMEELQKINFQKHILLKDNADSNRGGSQNEALELLSVLMRDHRDEEGNYDSINEDVLIDNNQQCKDKLTEYLGRTNAEELTKNVSALRDEQLKLAARSDNRPKSWADLMGSNLFKPVPVQEGEGLPVDDVIEEDANLPKVVLDPLGLTELDLRAAQELHAAGAIGFNHQGNRPGRSSNAVAHLRRGHHMPPSSQHRGNWCDGEGDEEDEEVYSSLEKQSTGRVSSVVPDDKTFSPELFLTLVHGNTSFEQLQQGAANLRQQLLQQENHREALVRANFGLFVHCAEGLEWLKEYRRGMNQKASTSTQKQSVSKGGAGSSPDASAKTSVTGAQRGELKLKQAQISLDAAKEEANSTLAPILERMKRSRMMRSAEQVIKRLSATLEHPHDMRTCLQRGEMEEACAIYAKVLSISTSTSLRVVQRVKESCHILAVQLRQRCLDVLQRPETSFATLLRHGRVLAQLDGSEAYRSHMRTCFATQLQYMNILFSKLILRFLDEVAEANAYANKLRSERRRQRVKQNRRNLALLSVEVTTEVPSKLRSARKWRPTKYKNPFSLLGDILEFSEVSAQHPSSVHAHVQKTLAPDLLSSRRSSTGTSISGRLNSPSNYTRSIATSSQFGDQEAEDNDKDDSDSSDDDKEEMQDKAQSDEEEDLAAEEAALTAPIITTVDGHNRVTRTASGVFLEGFDHDEEDQSDSSSEEGAGTSSKSNSGKKGSDEKKNIIDSSSSEESANSSEDEDKAPDEAEQEVLAAQARQDLEAYNQDCTMLGNIVREAHLLRLLDALDVWLPCLHQMVTDTSSVASAADNHLRGAPRPFDGNTQAPTQGFLVPKDGLLSVPLSSGSTATPTKESKHPNSNASHVNDGDNAGSAPAGSGAKTNSTNKTASILQRSKVKPPSYMISVALLYACEAINQCVRGYSSRTQHQAQHEEDHLFQPELTMKAKAVLFGHERVLLGGRTTSKPAAYLSTQHAYNDILNKRFLARAVKEVGRSFQDLVLVLGTPTSPGSKGSNPGGSLFDNSPMIDISISIAGEISTRSPYYDALQILKALSKEGEQAIAARGMNKLARGCIHIFERRVNELERRLTEAHHEDATRTARARILGVRAVSGYSNESKSSSAVDQHHQKSNREQKQDHDSNSLVPQSKYSMIQLVNSIRLRISKSLNTLSSNINRTEWVQNDVYCGILGVFVNMINNFRHSGFDSRKAFNPNISGSIFGSFDTTRGARSAMDVETEFSVHRLRSSSRAGSFTGGGGRSDTLAPGGRTSTSERKFSQGRQGSMTSLSKSQGRQGSVTSLSKAAESLRGLVTQLQYVIHDYVYDEDRGEELLELLHASILLRTDVMPGLWVDAMDGFPQEETAANSRRSMFGDNSRASSAVPGEGMEMHTGKSITPGFGNSPQVPVPAPMGNGDSGSHMFSLFGTIDNAAPPVSEDAIKVEVAVPAPANLERRKSRAMSMSKNSFRKEAAAVKAIGEQRIAQRLAQPLETQLWDFCMGHPLFEPLIPPKSNNLVDDDEVRLPILPQQVSQSFREIVSLESKIAGSYVSVRARDYEVTILAGYAITSRNEKLGFWEKLKKLETGPSVVGNTTIASIVPTSGRGATYGRSRIMPHFVRLLASLGHERVALRQLLGRCGMRYGTVERSTNGKSRARTDSANSGYDTNDEDKANAHLCGEAQRSNISMLGKPTEPPTEDTMIDELYCDYLFREVCAQVLEMYVSLINALKENILFGEMTRLQVVDPIPVASAESGGVVGGKKVNHRGSMCRSGLGVDASLAAAALTTVQEAGSKNRPVCETPLTLGRAVEEVRYLRDLLLPKDIPSQPISHTGARALGRVNEVIDDYDKEMVAYRKLNTKTGKAYAGTKFLSCKQLQEEAVLMSMMVQSLE